MLQSVELPRRQDRLPKCAWAKRALMLSASTRRADDRVRGVARACARRQEEVDDV